MKCNGKFIFKGVEERQGGEFKNSQGQLIKYNSSYIIKVDELTENGVYERKLKMPKSNTELLRKLGTKKLYDEINLLCEISFFGNQVKVIPVDLIEQQNNK